MTKYRFCIGTAKLDDLTYGYSSRDIYEEASSFLEKLQEFNFYCIDTAPRYGESESIIGRNIDLRNNQFFVSSKIDGISPNSQYTVDHMIKSVKETIKKLKIDFLPLCYLHQNELNILSDKYVLKGIKSLKESGLIKDIGSSIYNDDELDYTLGSNRFDWVQIPINILDTYFFEKTIKHKNKIKIAARSIFLQGLLFAEKQKIKEFRYRDLFLIERNKFVQELSKFNVNFKAAAVSFINSLTELDMIIIGTRAYENLREFERLSSIQLSSEVLSYIKNYSRSKKVWNNPRNWKNS